MKKTLLFCIFTLALASCSGVENKREDNKTFNFKGCKIGRYIYRDDNYVYHIDAYCPRLMVGKDDKGHDIYAKHMIDTAEFKITKPEYFRVCSRCVTDKDYETILRIDKRNNMRGKAKQWLYDKFVQANYDMPDFNTYCMRLGDREIRHRLYLIAQEEGWNVGATEEEFSNLLGYSQ